MKVSGTARETQRDPVWEAMLFQRERIRIVVKDQSRASADEPGEVGYGHSRPSSRGGPDRG